MSAEDTIKETTEEFNKAPTYNKNIIYVDKLSKVESSNIDLIGFDNGSTFIKFNNGNLYRYPNTTVEEFTALSEAESVGKEFFKSFKKKEEFALLDNTELGTIKEEVKK